MTKIAELLEAAKDAKGVKTKYALAKALELHSGLISDYYAGKRYPDEFACLQIAKALGRSYEEISAIVRIEAEKDETRRQAWKDHLKRLGGYAASIMLALLAGLMFVTFIVTTMPSALANQQLTNWNLQEYKLCIFARRVRSRFKSLVSVARHMLSTAFPHPCLAG